MPISQDVPDGITSPSIQAINTSVLSKRELSPSSINCEPANFFLPSTPLISVFSIGEYKSTLGMASLIFFAHSRFLNSSP